MSHNPNALLKAVSENQEAVIYALDATELVQESMERLDAWPPATKHLGQAMMATLLLHALSDADEKDSLSLQWMCDGPFGHCYAEAKNFGECRGTIRQVHAPVPDYETNLGPGILQVRKSRDGAATTSVVEAKGDVSGDVVEYLEKSEQKNCGINLSVQIDWKDRDSSRFHVTEARAYLVHIMPQPNAQKLEDALVRWNRQMLALGPISKWMLRPEQSTLDMVRLITGEENPKVVMSQRVRFQCSCSPLRASRALSLLERLEAQGENPTSQEETQVRCEYCGHTYFVKAGPMKEKTSAKQKKRKGESHGQ